MRLTGGLTDRIREAFYGKGVNDHRNSFWFNVGMGAGIAAGFALDDPCAMAAIPAWTTRAVQTLQYIGNVANAYDAAQNFGQDLMAGNAFGDVGDAANFILNAVAAAGNVSALSKACFAAGTPLLTPTGHKPIEQFQVGDLLLSRDEDDPAGAVQPKVVEEVFFRLGEIWHLHVGGQVIRTTGEHPFYVKEQGWVDCQGLSIGDLLLSHDGQWVAVEDLLNTRELETVYNLRIADWHTYFVGATAWRFSAWAHNAACEVNFGEVLKKQLWKEEAGGELSELAFSSGKLPKRRGRLFMHTTLWKRRFRSCTVLGPMCSERL